MPKNRPNKEERMRQLGVSEPDILRHLTPPAGPDSTVRRIMERDDVPRWLAEDIAIEEGRLYGRG